MWSYASWQDLARSAYRIGTGRIGGEIVYTDGAREIPDHSRTLLTGPRARILHLIVAETDELLVHGVAGEIADHLSVPVQRVPMVREGHRLLPSVVEPRKP